MSLLGFLGRIERRKGSAQGRLKSDRRGRRWSLHRLQERAVTHYIGDHCGQVVIAQIAHHATANIGTPNHGLKRAKTGKQ